LKVSLVAENRADDGVVALTPSEIKRLIKETNAKVFVETNAGIGSGFSDSEYKSVGAKIVDRKTAYKSDIIVRENEISRSELETMIPGLISISMLHHDGVPQRRIDLEETGVVGIALNFITNDFGGRAVYLWELTAENGMKEGYKLIDKNPNDCNVKLLGYGNLARGAMTYAAREGSDVTVLNKRHMKELEKHLPGTDILVNCVKWPLDKRGKELIITRDMVKTYMREGSVIVDLIVNPKGDSPIETCRPTYLDNLSYEEEGVWHTCCWGWPNYTPKVASTLYSKLIVPHVIELVNKGPLNVNQHIKNAYVNLEALNEKFNS